MTHLKCGYCSEKINQCENERCNNLFDLYGEIFCTPEGHFCAKCTRMSTVQASEN